MWMKTSNTQKLQILRDGERCRERSKEGRGNGKKGKGAMAGK